MWMVALSNITSCFIVTYNSVHILLHCFVRWCGCAIRGRW